MTSLFEHSTVEEVSQEVNQEGMGLAGLANSLEPMLLKFREDLSSIGNSVIKRLKNQVGRGTANTKKSGAPKRKVGSSKQVGGGRSRPTKKKPPAKKIQIGKGKKSTTAKKNPSKKRKKQTNF